jgi:hypothetical protein
MEHQKLQIRLRRINLHYANVVRSLRQISSLSLPLPDRSRMSDSGGPPRPNPSPSSVYFFWPSLSPVLVSATLVAPHLSKTEGWRSSFGGAAWVVCGVAEAWGGVAPAAED